MTKRFTEKWALQEAQKIRDKHNKQVKLAMVGKGSWDNICSARGISWGKDKEIGNLYHAYCEFCSDLFEDATKYKSDCETYARKHGWIIGRKEYNDLAICPKCKTTLKDKYKIEND